MPYYIYFLSFHQKFGRANFSIPKSAFNAQQNKKAAKYLQQAQVILENLPKINSLSEAKRYIYNKRADNVLEVYVKVLDSLRKADGHGNTKVLLLQVYKSIGLLALAKKNYILSLSVFGFYHRLEGQENLLKLLAQEENRDVKRVVSIMVEVKAHKGLSEGEEDYKMDAWVVEISRMKHPKVVRKLLPYVNSNNWRQRLLACRTLGKLGDKTTKVGEKNSVDWLLKRLKKLNPVEDKKLEKTPIVNEEIEKLIWALGWLADARAEDLVCKKRWQAGNSSPLWNKTKIPYKWIPVSSNHIPNSAEAYNIRANAKNNKSDFYGAIADYTQAISLNPKDSEAYNNRGNAYYYLKEHQKAIADYTQAISLDPKLSTAYNNRGSAYYYLKEYQRAIVDYTQAISLDPKLSTAYNNRGLTYSDLKEHQKAIADYTQAISLDPKYSEAYNNRGLTYNDLKEHQKAIADYTQSISLNPKYSEAYNNRGLTYSDLKKYQRAIVDYTQAISLNPKDSLAYNNRGVAFIGLKEHQRAIANYTEAVSLNPKDSLAYNNRGNAYSDLKEYQRAIADYTQAISLNHKSSLAYYNRGVAYIGLKEYQRAIADYTQAISLDPKFSRACLNRAIAFMEVKQHKLAASDFRRYLKLQPNASQANQIRAYIRQHSK